jgi:NAD(P)-dependent dehydrogenase (short-subunit alcohol dehydrogenase family)
MSSSAEASAKASGRFTGKTVVVTGAGGGIGLAVVRRFAMEGAHVVAADIDLASAESAIKAGSVEGGPEGWAFRCDVSNEDQVSACVDGAIAHFGRLDVIVNNAGLMTFTPLIDLTADDWRRVLGVDLLGAFFFIRQGFLKMKPGSAIVNVSSIHARETTPLVSPYAAAKAALVSLTRSAALEGKPRGIRVNAVLPGAIDTPMLWDNPNVKSGVERIDSTMVGKPEDLAATIAFLASNEAAFVQGATLVVDGGQLDRL